MSLSVIIADDHMIVREGLRTILSKVIPDAIIKGEAANGKQLLALAKESPADIYIIDIKMPLLNGIEATQQLIKMDKNAKVIILSMYDDSSSVEMALQQGARGYILKECLSEEIVQAISTVLAGEYYLSSQVSRYIIENFLGSRNEYKREKRLFHLTPKEKAVLQRIAEGYSSKEIARDAGITLNTVNVHRKNIMRKLDLHKQADLVRFAFREGIARL